MGLKEQVSERSKIFQFVSYVNKTSWAVASLSQPEIIVLSDFSVTLKDIGNKKLVCLFYSKQLSKSYIKLYYRFVISC